MKQPLLLLALALSLTSLAYGQAGSLDASFDTDGKAATDIAGGNDEGHAVAIQTDGKIVVVGSAFNSSNLDFALVRYNADGTLDASFGTGGKVTTDFFGRTDIAHSVATQTNGQIVVVGTTDNGSNFDFALARYNTDGSLDTGFDADGKVNTDFFGLNDVAQSVAIQIDGRIVVAGRADTNIASDFAVVRYNADGSLDTSFDADGKTTTDFFGLNDVVNSVTIQTDGRIVAAGTAEKSTDFDFALARYNPDGSPDTSFDTDGKAFTDFAGFNEVINSVAIQTDGGLVAAGTTDNGTDDDFALARYNPDGSLDTSFDADGKTTTDFFGLNDVVNSVTIQTDGRIVAAGRAQKRTDFDFAVARYNVLPAECLDPATAPSYAGGYVLNTAQSRAFVVVTAPQGGATFDFYNTSNLVVGDPETDTESMTVLTGFNRAGDSFSFAPGSEPTEAYFPITTAGAGTQVSFYLRVTDTCDRTVDVDPRFTFTDVTDDVLSGFALAPAMPTPTTGQATIRFSLEQSAQVRLAVYDVLGREVARLVEGVLSEGAHGAAFDASSLPSGLYVYRLTAGGRTLTRTLTVAR